MLLKIKNIGTQENPKIVELSKNMSAKEKEEYVNLMKKHTNVFSQSYENLKEYDTSIIQHTIPIKPGEKPFREKLKRINPKLLLVIDCLMPKLLSLRFSRWVANLVLVREKKRRNKALYRFQEFE